MSNRRHRQAGSILVPVMLIGLTSTLIMGALINYSLYLEQAAVENRLAESAPIGRPWAISVTR